MGFEIFPANCMKCQTLFSGKNKKRSSTCICCLLNLPRVLKFNKPAYYCCVYELHVHIVMGVRGDIVSHLPHQVKRCLPHV